MEGHCLYFSTAHWSDWQVTYGKCKGDLKRIKKTRRFCLNPSQLKDKHGHCSGNGEMIELVVCQRDQSGNYLSILK